MMSNTMDLILHEMRFNLEMTNSLVKDVPDDVMTRQFGELKNHPAWQLGHIVVSHGYLASLIGADYTAPQGWEALFPPGTHPVDDPGLYPDKATLLDELSRVCDALAARLPALDAQALAQPFPEERFRSYWPTLGNGVSFFLTSHFAFHLGQLSAWRRAMNLPPAMGG